MLAEHHVVSTSQHGVVFGWRSVCALQEAEQHNAVLAELITRSSEWCVPCCACFACLLPAGWRRSHECKCCKRLVNMLCILRLLCLAAACRMDKAPGAYAQREAEQLIIPVLPCCGTCIMACACCAWLLPAGWTASQGPVRWMCCCCMSCCPTRTWLTCCPSTS